MGSVPDQDVAQEPTLPLKAVMALAADRDLVARQYTNGFHEVFTDALPALEEALRLGRSIETATVAAHLTLLSRHPDSLIVRKAGIERSAEVSRRAARSSRRAGRIVRRGCGCVPSSTIGSATRAGRSTLARRPTWSRRPCMRRCEMGQFRYHSPRIRPVDREIPAFLPSIEGVSGAIEDKDTPAMPSPQFQVRVTKDYLVFCSGHFITYQGDQCERIHGHNYRTAVEVEGDLDENHYVIDFIALKDLTKSIIDELDHRMMLPTRSRHILLHEEGPNIRVTYGDRYWSFPREECALVPIANTTAELLADYIAGRLRTAMSERGWAPPRLLRVEVEESFGQSARVEWRAEDSPGSALIRFSRSVAVCDAIRSSSRRPMRPSWIAEPTSTADAPWSATLSTSSIPRIPPPTVISTPTHRVRIRARRSSVPMPRPVPTRARSSRMSRRTPSSTASRRDLDRLDARPGGPGRNPRPARRRGRG